MAKPPIDTVWNRIRASAGKPFETKTGKPFTYTVDGNVFRPSRTDYQISKADFGTALALAPFEGPGIVSDTVRGPSYIWPVLHDSRIRQKDW
jgi:hypothetical protein